jgi:2-oxoglutarate dehydrogenase E2 component (dihydrolipoamide succinyltransferase)
LAKLNLDIGDYVKVDEAIASIETGKAAVDIKSPVDGKILKFFAEVGATVLVGNDFAVVDETASPPSREEAAKPEETKTEQPKVEEKKPEEKPEEKPEKKPEKKPESAKETPKPTSKPAPKPEARPKIEAPSVAGTRNTRRVPMGKLREAAAERLKDSQNIYAMLTTFNECDMSAITSLRKDLGPEFSKRYGIDLTFMSAFVKAATMSLMKYPAINGLIDGREIVYHDYVDMAVEVATPKGIIVPVLRNCESLSFANIEKVKVD